MILKLITFKGILFYNNDLSEFCNAGDAGNASKAVQKMTRD